MDSRRVAHSRQAEKRQDLGWSQLAVARLIFQSWNIESFLNKFYRYTEPFETGVWDPIIKAVSGGHHIQLQHLLVLLNW